LTRGAASLIAAMLLGAAVLLGAPAALYAVDFEITPSFGGVAGGGVSTRQGDLTFDPGPSLGLMLSWRVRYDGLVEIDWSRQQTEIDLESRPLFDATLDYVHFGGVWEIRDGATRPYIGLGLGASRIDPDADFDTELLFSAGLYGGVKHWFGDRFGVRLEGRGLLHAAGSGGGFFCGSAGGGASCAVDLQGDGFLQVQALVGLIARFGG
jgi:hypothetical protein